MNENDASKTTSNTEGASSPFETDPDAFRKMGHELVESLAGFLETLREAPVTAEVPITDVVEQLSGPLPEEGASQEECLRSATKLVLSGSLRTSHPRFWGYIIGSGTPIGALADLLGSMVNPNCAAWYVGPAAFAIEHQVIRWVSELLGYEQKQGLIVSGGSMANILGLCCALERHGYFHNSESRAELRIYATKSTHTWLKKAARLFGLKDSSLRWVDVDAQGRLDTVDLESKAREDMAAGYKPLAFVANAGTTSIGAVDPISRIGELAREVDAWFHIDGAYGAFAAASTNPPAELSQLGVADSIAVDPHKWLYAPFEAGCVLTKHTDILESAFKITSPYYGIPGAKNLADELPPHFRDIGPQTSRGFKALKVWLNLQVAGRVGYRNAIDANIGQAREFFSQAQESEVLEAVSHNLSIATLRFVPTDLRDSAGEQLEYLNRLNAEILREVQEGGFAYPSHTTVAGAYVIRVCVVNFRTTSQDVREFIEQLQQIGTAMDAKLRSR